MSKTLVFQHASVIQFGQAVLFYQYRKDLDGYLVAGVHIAPDVDAKLDFVKIWKYFLDEVVRDKEVYCSLATDVDMFSGHIHYHSEINGLKIYKIDNFLKAGYSSYIKAIS